jgi:hypothetical protein
VQHVPGSQPASSAQQAPVRHTPPQFTEPAGHWQVPFWQVLLPVQALPHEPQLALLVSGLMH